MEIRALKRQHYFKRSMNDYYNIDENKTVFEDEIYEENMMYEDLIDKR